MDVIHLPYSITIKSCGQLVQQAEGLRTDWAVRLLRWVSECKVRDNILSKNSEPSGFITTIYIEKKNYKHAGCNETHIQITHSLPIFFLLSFSYSCVACECTRLRLQERRSLRVSSPPVRRACKRFAKSLRGFCPENETPLKPLSSPFCSPTRISKAPCLCRIFSGSPLLKIFWKNIWPMEYPNIFGPT